MVREKSRGSRGRLSFFVPDSRGRNVALGEPVFPIVAAISERQAASNQSAKDTTHSRCLNPQPRQRSGGATFVPMMEPTDFGDRHDPAGFWCLGGA